MKYEPTFFENTEQKKENCHELQIFSLIIQTVELYLNFLEPVWSGQATGNM